MRHLIANAVTLGIALALLTGAAIFAWMRSGQVVPSTESEVLARFSKDPVPEGALRDLGEQSYMRNCANCHRRDGSGWDQYPPVTDASRYLQSREGRAFLIDLHLYGLTSDRWRAPMPPMGHIQDIELASLLNFLVTKLATQPATDPPFSPAEIASQRGQALRPALVEQRRPSQFSAPSAAH